MKDVLYYIPLFIAPIILAIFGMISAYVMKFKLPGSMLGFDYLLFSIVVIVALTIGGAI